MNLRKSIVDLLAANGIAPEQAEELAGKLDLPREEQSVGIDKLEKSLGDLRVLLEREQTAGDDVLRKAMQQQTDIAEAVTHGSDALLAEHREQNEMLLKSLTLTTDVLRDFGRELNALRIENADLKTLITGEDGPVGELRKAIRMPVGGGRSVQDDADVLIIPTAGDIKPEDLASMRDELSALIGNEVNKPGTDRMRKSALFEASSQLCAGGRPDVLAKSLGFKLGGR